MNSNRGFFAGLALALVVCALMPFDIFHVSAEDFQTFGRWELLSFVSVATVVVAILGALLSRVSVFARAFLFMLAVLLYLQGNLIGLNYGALDGHQIEWESLSQLGYVNTAIWVCGLIGGTIGFAWLVRKYSDIAVLVEFAFCAYVLILVGCNAFFSPVSDDRPVRLDDGNLMELSSDRNLVVFVIDSYDRGLFDLALDRHVEVRRDLAGFTYFHDTVGCFPSTGYSLPHLVTGNVVVPSAVSGTQYRDRCYRNATFLESAGRMGFEVDLYDEPIVSPRASDARRLGCFGNAEFGGSAYWSKTGIATFRSIMRVALFKYLPHACKRKYWEYLMRRGFGCANSDGEEADVRTERLLGERLKSEHPFSITAKKKVKIYHLRGVHVPKFNLEQAMVTHGLIRRYVDEVSRAGLAEKTAFVVLADHGVLNRSHPIFLCSNGSDAFVEDPRPVSYRRMCEIFLSGLTHRVVSVPAAQPDEMRSVADDHTIFRKNFIEDATTCFKGRLLELIRLSPNMDTVGDRERERIVWDGKPGFFAIPIAPALRGKAIEAVFAFATEADAKAWAKALSTRFVADGSCCKMSIPVSAIDASRAFVRILLPKWSGDGNPPSVTAISISAN